MRAAFLITATTAATLFIGVVLASVTVSNNARQTLSVQASILAN